MFLTEFPSDQALSVIFKRSGYDFSPSACGEIADYYSCSDEDLEFVVSEEGCLLLEDSRSLRHWQEYSTLQEACLNGYGYYIEETEAAQEMLSNFIGASIYPTEEGFLIFDNRPPLRKVS